MFPLNSIALMTAGAAVLGLHAISYRPRGESNSDYYKIFPPNSGVSNYRTEIVGSS
jgi:hypothetical protein